MKTQHVNAAKLKAAKGRLQAGGCLLVLFGLLVLYYSLYFIFRRALPEYPRLVAHRGDSKHAPENTLAAFQSAIAIGADRLEFDVQMTRDGALVVIHDETVDRTTNGTGAVKELTLAEIRALDAGNGQQVPTFEEVVALAKESETGIMPEIKSPHLYPGIEAKIVRAIEAAGYVDKTFVQSFNPQSLVTIKALNPSIMRCRLHGPGQFNLSRQTDIVCPMAEMVILYPWMLRQAQAAGQPVFVWFGFIEHPWVMRLLLAMGVDGLMVDDPQALAEILNRN